ncbi:hypothetical protein LXL04_010513 [Taraxacum kok-saghyz]
MSSMVAVGHPGWNASSSYSTFRHASGIVTMMLGLPNMNDLSKARKKEEEKKGEGREPTRRFCQLPNRRGTTRKGRRGTSARCSGVKNGVVIAKSDALWTTTTHTGAKSGAGMKEETNATKKEPLPRYPLPKKTVERSKEASTRRCPALAFPRRCTPNEAGVVYFFLPRRGHCPRLLPPRHFGTVPHSLNKFGKKEKLIVLRVE